MGLNNKTLVEKQRDEMFMKMAAQGDEFALVFAYCFENIDHLCFPLQVILQSRCGRQCPGQRDV